jgi:hypothetical protein
MEAAQGYSPVERATDAMYRALFLGGAGRDVRSPVQELDSALSSAR